MDRAGVLFRMSKLNPAGEGLASFRGFQTRFRVVGNSRSHWPLLCVHGGPGLGSDYLQPLEAMATTGRQVVFYDQFGCGSGQAPVADPEWSLQLFVEELAAVRAAAGLERCHLLGHGWGGIVALQYALGQPSGLESLVLSSTVASVPQWRADIARLVEALPEDIRGPLQQHIRAGGVTSPVCQCVVDAFMRHHFCRMNPWPDSLSRCQARARGVPEARHAMLGASEIQPAGQLENWDVTGWLGEIACPTLVVSGRYDMVPPPSAAALYRGIPGSEWVVFEHSAHVPHLEEPERYLEVLDGFLEKNEHTVAQRV